MLTSTRSSVAPSALTHSKRTLVFQFKGGSVSTSAALNGPKYHDKPLRLEHIVQHASIVLGRGKVLTCQSHKFSVVRGRVFHALAGRTADLLQHCSIVFHGQMLSRHRWQSRCDNGIRIASSSGRKCELDNHVARVGKARFAQTLGTYYN